MNTEQIFAYKRLNYIAVRYLYTRVLYYQSCRYPMNARGWCVSYINISPIYKFIYTPTDVN